MMGTTSEATNEATSEATSGATDRAVKRVRSGAGARRVWLAALAPALALALAPAAARAEPQPLRRWYFYAGAAHVATLEQSREVELADVQGPASLAVRSGPIAGSGSEVSSATIPAGTLGYRLRALGGRLSLELVLGPPFDVKFRATGTLANQSIAPVALGIPTGVPALGEELGEARAVPPVLTAVYQLRQGGRLRPYAGGGVSVLFATGEKITNPILTEVGEPDFSIAPAPGLVLQGGVEARLTGRFFARLDVKFIAGMLARARAEHVQVRTPALPLFESVEVGTAEVSVWVNPLIVQAGIGADF